MNLWMWIGVETNYESEYEQYVKGNVHAIDHMVLVYISDCICFSFMLKSLMMHNA